MDFLCIDFLNSDWRDWRGTGRKEDRLDKPEWLANFLQHWGLTAPLPPDPKTRLALAELRRRMRAMVERLVSGSPLYEADLQEINLVLERVTFHSQLVKNQEGYRLDKVTKVQGWPLIMGAIAASFAELISSNGADRIKICANEDCRWVYYDESRNRTRRWCDDKMCGNLLKVRRFRQRQKAKGKFPTGK